MREIGVPKVAARRICGAYEKALYSRLGLGATNNPA